MRISEKTVELNLCAQISQHLNQRILWFGLTQKQEASLGFDAATNLNGRALLFQFKASNNTLGNKARRFYLQHDQLRSLQNLLPHVYGSIFYAFPLIGNTGELYQKNGDFYNNTWLLDVASLPSPFPEPFTQTNPPRLRVNPVHYADVWPSRVIIHSDPVEANLESLSDIVKRSFAGADGINWLISDYKNNFEKLLHILKPLRQNFKMAVILPNEY